MLGPIHTRGGGLALDEELKQWGFKSRFRAKGVPSDLTEAEAATWQVRFAGRAVGLSTVQQQIIIINRGTTDIAMDWSLFPHELGVHNTVQAVTSTTATPAWAAELQQREDEERRQADAREAERQLGIQQKKLEAMKASCLLYTSPSPRDS